MKKGRVKRLIQFPWTQDAIHFDGIVDHVVDFTDIQNIEYKKETFEGKRVEQGKVPPLFLAGDAKDKELESVKAYVYYDKPYYIIIYTENDTFVFNLPKSRNVKIYISNWNVI